MDKLTKKQRSFNMSQIKSKNTKPELLIFSLLDSAKINFEKHLPIMGKPDIAFPEKMTLVFIDGEFWHGKYFKQIEASLQPFWSKKISENIKRDRRVRRKLRKEGWHVLHFWDKQITKSPEKSFKRIIRFLENKDIPDRS
ncbi:DNA mismatch endonuclease Vsr [Candidatus Roizmanbacteria bacterium]|nr:DNA mismatch endonuclease Vsr [Candidatus Roizmanbacteria bacterium]